MWQTELLNSERQPVRAGSLESLEKSKYLSINGLERELQVLQLQQWTKHASFFGYHKHRLTPIAWLPTTLSSLSNQCCYCNELCCLLTQNSLLPFCFYKFRLCPECDQAPRGGFIKLKAAYGSYIPADMGVPRSLHRAWPCLTEFFASAAYRRETVKVSCGQRSRQGGKTRFHDMDGLWTNKPTAAWLYKTLHLLLI